MSDVSDTSDNNKNNHSKLCDINLRKVCVKGSSDLYETNKIPTSPRAIMKNSLINDTS
jgi:hypothetical protein